MTATAKNIIKNPAFWVCLSLSIILIVAGFCVPPTGKIDGSVLKAVGELFGFATLEVIHNAIRKGVDAKVSHGNTSVLIGDTSNDNDNRPPERVDDNGDEMDESD